MNIFNKKTTWTNWEFIPLKICIASFYMLVGACYSSIVLQYKTLIMSLFLITTTLTLYTWLTKMKEEN